MHINFWLKCLYLQSKTAGFSPCDVFSVVLQKESTSFLSCSFQGWIALSCSSTTAIYHWSWGIRGLSQFGWALQWVSLYLQSKTAALIHCKIIIKNKTHLDLDSCFFIVFCLFNDMNWARIDVFPVVLHKENTSVSSCKFSRTNCLKLQPAAAVQ